MAIKQLSLNDFRNLKSVTLDFSPSYNLIIGDNGSGKTSLLEAIFIVCQGRSFKTNHLNECIQHSKNNYLLFAKFDMYQVGISRSKQKTHIRLNQENIKRISSLIERTPIINIDSKSFDLLLGPPSLRREYIDWCLFHVEHNYRKIWGDYSRSLKQKNILLKSGKSEKEIDYWDRHLSQLCKQIYQYRKDYLDMIIQFYKNLNAEMKSGIDISIEYKPGWDNKEDPLTSLVVNRQKEMKKGFSSIGSHRDLINITVNDIVVSEVLSRGQLKKLSINLLLSQILLVKSMTNKNIIVLIDDLESELDDKNVINIIKLLKTLDVQLFVTNIRLQEYLTESREEYKMFHVEHGMIKPVKNT